MNNLPVINNQEIIFLFFKLFSLAFSFLYLVFSIISFQQSKIINRIIQVKNGSVFVFLSLIQLFFAIFLILMAIFL